MYSMSFPFGFKKFAGLCFSNEGFRVEADKKSMQGVDEG